MRNVELALRKAYVTAITAADTGAQCYFGEAQRSDDSGKYIIIQNISVGNESTKTTNDVEASVTLVITTSKNSSNSGFDAAEITDKVLEAIQLEPSSNLDLNEFDLQCYHSKLVSQNTKTWTVQNQLVYVDTTLVFRHKIFIKNRS